LGKFPFQSLLAALLLLALAFPVHDRSAAQAQKMIRVSLQPTCESNSDQELNRLRGVPGPTLPCAAKVAKK
jgi:hypothetical protein